MSTVIRPARLSDAPALARVMVDTWLSAHRGQIPEGQWQRRRDEWTYAVSEQGWRELLEGIDAGHNPQECVYVAVTDRGETDEDETDEDETDEDETDEGELVGVAVGCPARLALLDNAAEVSAIYVRPAHQGRGLGRRLVQAVAAHQARLGRRALLISVLETNAPARRFYEALGGHVAGSHETEDYGFKEPQVVYGWEDIGALESSGR
jgi:ribosomal protein S18 acetylase RimI-like enzyme